MRSINNIVINNIWTRIFYKDQVVNYELSIQLIDGTSHIYEVFANYQKYRETLDKLVKAKDNGESIDILKKGQRA